MVAFDFPEEVMQFISDNIEGNSYPKMTELVNERFGTSYTVNQMHHQYTKHKLRSGLTGRFEKDCVPWNRGKNVDFSNLSPQAIENMRKTHFKPGHTPWTVLPIGSEKIKNGFIYVKTAEPNVWKRKQILIWEQHYGPVPEGACVIFLNGDRTDFSLENLELVSKAEHLRLNERHWRFDDPELQKVALNVVRLKSKIGDRER